MKVILVSPYSEKLVGGIINWTKYIVNYHREHDGGVDMRLLNNENAKQMMAGANPLKRIVAGIYNYLPVYKQFKKEIDNEEYNVVHLCTSASFGLIRDMLIVRAAKKRGIKTIIHMHFGRIPEILNKRGWERILLKKLVKQVDQIVVMDRTSLKSMEAMGLRNVSFLPNPLSVEVQQLIEKHKQLRRDSRKVVYAGHISEAKGVYELVKACREIKDIKLELLGKVAQDDIRERLFNEAGENADEWLIMPGNKTQEEVIREMLTCTLFVLPSYSEGFPNVIIESMACGCAIVATSVGAIPEMLGVESMNPCGICVPPHNAERLQEAMQSLIYNPLEAVRLGKNARMRVNEIYIMPIVWNQLLEIWQKVEKEDVDEIKVVPSS